MDRKAKYPLYALTDHPEERYQVHRGLGECDPYAKCAGVRQNSADEEEGGVQTEFTREAEDGGLHVPREAIDESKLCADVLQRHLLHRIHVLRVDVSAVAHRVGATQSAGMSAEDDRLQFHRRGHCRRA